MLICFPGMVSLLIPHAYYGRPNNALGDVGDGGAASSATLTFTESMFYKDEKVYFASKYSCRVRVLDLAAMTVSHIAGSECNFSGQDDHQPINLGAGEDIRATSALLEYPQITGE